MNKLINAISIKNYRGFKEEQFIELADNNQITYLVGQNNSGKSLISRILSIINQIEIPDSHNQYDLPIISLNNISDTDFYDAVISNPIEICIYLNKEYLNGPLRHRFSQCNFEEVILSYTILRYNSGKGSSFECYCFIRDQNISYAANSTRSGKLLEYQQDFLKNHGLDEPSSNFLALQLIDIVYNSFLIFAPIRSLKFSNSNTSFIQGSEIITWLKEKKDISSIKETKKRVGQYLARLNLDLPLSVEVNQDWGLLDFSFGDYLTLTSDDVGTGYTMIYILLMELLRNQKKVVIIDEIESHLQPGLIRELIKIIREIGSVQFIIATHSPTVIESANENDYLYRFQKKDLQCLANKFYRNNNDAKILRSVCNELGIIPGDALLSNCVVWVEGPSEVLWLRAWMKVFISEYRKIKKISSSILEGLHYSILMTGGSLIANISFDEKMNVLDSIDEDFALQVLRVNPNPFVILDSDNAQIGSKKIDRQLRIAKEINNQNQTSVINGLAIKDEITKNNIHLIKNLWLLKGKELENYCHPQLLKDFYFDRVKKPQSTISGHDKVLNWDVYSNTQGPGEILEERGLKNASNGKSIKHKMQLASYVFQNLSIEHFAEDSTDILQPDKKMLNELKMKLIDIFDYIVAVNNLN